MSAENLETDVTYEQLQDLEDDFEEVELELLRQQAKLSKALYARREKLVSEIPNFWPLVFEQSPADIDEYIQPSDAALLLGSLRSLSVERFELPDGDPRSISIRFEFADNDHFDDGVLEKKFWWRRARDGWTGLVSEPVDIRWKSAGKDLTGGMLALARKVWDEDRAGKADDRHTEAKEKLRQLMSETGVGGVSFFAWFGFRGRDISADEHREASEAERKKREARKDGKETAAEGEDDSDSDDEDSDEYELEVFPTAEDLAVAIAEDLWPGAVKYFLQAQEQDAMSDLEFESDEDMAAVDGEDPPQKRRKRDGE